MIILAKQTFEEKIKAYSDFLLKNQISALEASIKLKMGQPDHDYEKLKKLKSELTRRQKLN